jgi:hypothetical protein
MGALSGALVGSGIPRNQAYQYETQVRAGKFLVMAHGTPEMIKQAEMLLSTSRHEGVKTYHAEPA